MSLASIRARLVDACQEAGRAPDAVALVAVTKSRSQSAVLDLIAQGQKIFGENRVAEAAAKFAPLRANTPDLELHMIGQLQTNKARDAVRLFDVIETLDRPRLALALRAAIDKEGRAPACLLQVNTGAEPQKGGVSVRDLDALYRVAVEEAGLNIRGLMCIPPAGEPAAAHFALLHQLGNNLALPVLSMGMSADFDVAIRHGATHIRVGSALFGG